nr:hypothetical protein GCM10010200_007550 [Actinomadura rugatobispora]
MALEALMMRSGATILADHPEGLRAQILWQMIVERHPAIEEEYVATGAKANPATNFRWNSVSLVKAGWVNKTGGRWYLTPVGRWALRQYTEPDRFFRQANDRYYDWERNRDAFQRAQELVEAVEESHWISAGEVADETGLDVTRLVHWFQGARPEGWWRLLDEGGHLPADAHLDETDREKWLGLLAADGVDVAQGRADPLRKVPIQDVVPVDEGEEVARRAWLVRGSDVRGAELHGENLIRTLWLRDNVCSLAASRLRDITTGAPLEVVKAAVNEDYSGRSNQDRARLAVEYHMFLTRMAEGDLILTNDGSQVYIGIVQGPASFRSSVDGRANLQRPVQWHDPGNPFDFAEDLPDELAAQVANPDADVIELSRFLAALENLIGPGTTVQPEMKLPDAPEQLARKLLVGHGWLQECVELLRERPQMIFYGPPGTGKTFLARELARHLVGGKPENVQLVQFHPAYSYEDFFEGYRPQKGKDGSVVFDVVHGPFRRLVSAAREHPGDPYVLIIDEINRGNLAKIFGELYFLLEYRRESVHLLYGSDEGQGFTLPGNVLLIGTMNTADRSIALVDAAMRRRFWFTELHPDVPPTRDVLPEWLKEKGYSDEPARLLTELNRRIQDRDFRIGPSYLMRDSVATEQGLERIWQKQIIPLLEEHHYGDGTDVQGQYGLDALRSALS